MLSPIVSLTRYYFWLSLDSAQLPYQFINCYSVHGSCISFTSGKSKWLHFLLWRLCYVYAIKFILLGHGSYNNKLFLRLTHCFLTKRLNRKNATRIWYVGRKFPPSDFWRRHLKYIKTDFSLGNMAIYEADQDAETLLVIRCKSSFYTVCF